MTPPLEVWGQFELPVGSSGAAVPNEAHSIVNSLCIKEKQVVACYFKKGPGRTAELPCESPLSMPGPGI